MRLQPIDTAPKDGRYIILFAKSGYRSTPLRCEICRYDADFRPHQPWVTCSGDSFLDSGDPPLYWLPLPDLPLVFEPKSDDSDMEKIFQACQSIAIAYPTHLTNPLAVYDSLDFLEKNPTDRAKFCKVWLRRAGEGPWSISRHEIQEYISKHLKDCSSNE